MAISIEAGNGGDYGIDREAIARMAAEKMSVLVQMKGHLLKGVLRLMPPSEPEAEPDSFELLPHLDMNSQPMGEPHTISFEELEAGEVRVFEH